MNAHDLLHNFLFIHFFGSTIFFPYKELIEKNKHMGNNIIKQH